MVVGIRVFTKEKSNSSLRSVRTIVYMHTVTLELSAFEFEFMLPLEIYDIIYVLLPEPLRRGSGG